MDTYLENCTKMVMKEAGMEEAEAKALVMSVMETMMEDGDIPKDAGDDEKASAAKAAGLDDAALALAHEIAIDQGDDEEDDDEEDDDMDGEEE